MKEAVAIVFIPILVGLIMVLCASHGKASSPCHVSLTDREVIGGSPTSCPVGKVVTGGEHQGLNVKLYCERVEVVCD